MFLKWPGEVYKAQQDQEAAGVMIILLKSNKHVNIACNNSRFCSVVQNSRNVKYTLHKLSEHKFLLSFGLQ